jgi:hypothetical protein
MMKSFGLCLGACAIVSSPAFADGTSLGQGEGGRVVDFLPIVRQYNASGELFRIQGVCKSACTMFLGIRNVCVERSATLMFHAGHDIKENVNRSGHAREPRGAVPLQCGFAAIPARRPPHGYRRVSCAAGQRADRSLRLQGMHGGLS